MGGSHSRRKGAVGEREVASLIHDLLGVQMRRRLSQYQQRGECDLEPADGSALLAGHAIEVKRHKAATQAAVARWWSEAKSQATGREPVLFYRGNGDDWRVVCRVAFGVVSFEPTITPAEWAGFIRVQRELSEQYARAREDQVDVFEKVAGSSNGQST